MIQSAKIGFIVQADLSTGGTAWIKRQAGPFRLGPREQATVFIDRITAQASIAQLPEAVRGSARFSIQSAGDFE
jgi:hypothetical protein